MATKYALLPQSLERCSPEFLDAIEKTIEFTFPKEIFGNGPEADLSKPVYAFDKSYRWKTGTELFKYVTSLTHTNNIKAASDVLYKTLSNFPEYSKGTRTDDRPDSELKGADESIVDSTVPQKGTREVQEATREQREESIQESIKKAKAHVQNEIERQEKLRLKTEGKKLYYKIETTETPLSQEQQQAIDLYQNAAENSPSELASITSDRIASVLKKSNPNLSNEEISAISNDVAASTVMQARGEKLSNSSIINKAIADNPSILGGIVDKESATFLQRTAERLYPNQVLEYINQRKIVAATIGNDFADKIYGPESLDSIKISFSNTPKEGYEEYDLGKTNSDYELDLKKYDGVLDDLGSAGIDKLKSKYIDRVSEWAVSKLPKGLVEKALSNKAILAAFDIFGVNVGSPVVWESTTFIGRLAITTGYGPILGWVGEFTGINFGVSAALGSFAPVAGETIATAALTGTETIVTAGSAGAETIAGFFGAGAEVATTALAGTEAGLVTTEVTAGVAAAPETAGISLLVAAAVAAVTVVAKKAWGKIKEWLPRLKKWILGAIGALFGMGIAAATGFSIIGGAFLGTLGGLTIGTLSSGGISAFTSGISSGLSNIGLVLGAIWHSFLGEIAKPILITFLVFSFLVALILFIINSGAYISPYTPIPAGGMLTKCDPKKTGKDITSELAASMKNGSVRFLPMTLSSREQGVCMDPTMIVLHTSGGYDNDQGNDATYSTLASRNVSCQMATDTNDTILMLSFFEKQVEFSWCADNLNAGGVSIEMAGEYMAGKADFANHAPLSKCSPEGSLMYTPDGPHPCPNLEDLAFDAICKVMQRYKIPWTQVFQHEASSGTHVDPVGDAWVDKFILRLKNNCQI